MARIFLSFLYLSCYLFAASTSMGIRRDAKLAQNATTVQTTKIAVAPPQPPTSPPEPIPAPSIGNSIPSSPPSTLDSGSVPPSEALSSSVPSNSLPVPSSVTFSDFQGPSSTENTSFVDTQVLTEAASSFTPFTSVESPLPTLETSSSFSAAFISSSSSVQESSLVPTVVVATVSSFSQSSIPSSTPPATETSEVFSRPNIFMIMGIIFGVIIFLLLLVVAVFCLRKRRRTPGFVQRFFRRPGHRYRPCESPFIWDRPNESDTDLIHQHRESVSGNIGTFDGSNSENSLSDHYQRYEIEEYGSEVSCPVMTAETVEKANSTSTFAVGGTFDSTHRLSSSLIQLPDAVFDPNTRIYSPYLQPPVVTDGLVWNLQSSTPRQVRLLPRPPSLATQRLSLVSSGVIGFSPTVPSPQIPPRSDERSEQIDHLLAHIQLLIDQQERTEWWEVLDPPPRYGDDSESVTCSEPSAEFNLGVAPRFLHESMSS